MSSVLIVSSIRWEYLWQRHQAFARAAAESGWDVTFLQPRPRNLRQVLTYRGRHRTPPEPGPVNAVPNGVRVCGPSGWLRLRERFDLAVVYLPDAVTELLLTRLNPGAVVYDAVVDWAAVPHSWFPPAGWAATERRLARRRRTVVTTDAPGMRTVLARRGIHADLIPPAADPDFEGLAGGVPHAARRDRVLYFGAVRDEVDSDLLMELATAGVPVDVIGTVERSEVRAGLTAAGVVVRGPVGLDELAHRCAEYKVVVLPYRGARAATIVPAKYWNAVAAGGWVLTRGLYLGELGGASTVDLGSEPAPGRVRALFATPPPAPVVPPSWVARWADLTEVAGQERDVPAT